MKLKTALYATRVIILLGTLGAFAGVNEHDSPRWEWPATVNTVQFPVRKPAQYVFTVHLGYLILGVLAWDVCLTLLEWLNFTPAARVQLLNDIVRWPACTVCIGALCGLTDAFALFFLAAVQLYAVLTTQNEEWPNPVYISAAFQAIVIPLTGAWYITYYFSIAGHSMPLYILSAVIAYFTLNIPAFRHFVSVFTVWALYLTIMIDNTTGVMYYGIAVGSLTLLWSIGSLIRSMQGGRVSRDGKDQ